ncbi:MAG: hypothetical protein AB8I08_19245 [Sandaracinaceae bacterium]
MTWRIPLLTVSLLLLAVGCAPSIGDSCGSSIDCSVNGDRTCDLTRPGGACTIFSCEADNCPDDAVCVRFRPDPSRLAFNACMRRCTQDGDCRFDDGYRCLGVDEITTTPESGEAIAELVDTEVERFCVATVPIPETEEE